MSNCISFVGTIGRDCEQRFLPSGQAVINVAVANNVGYGEKQKTNWFRVALFGKRAEGKLPEYLVKGQQVFVSGELSQSEYEKDGQTRITLEINAHILDLVGKRADDGGNQQAQQRPQQAQQQRPQQQQQQQSSHSSNDYPFDDDIPF